MGIQRWQPDEGVLLHATRVGWFVSYTDYVAHTAALVQALSWALDLLDMYDEKLIGLGEPSELVNSEIHLRGKAKARAALDGQP